MSSARGSTFYYGIRLLPREKREALFAVYALARRIDDIADGDLPADEKLRLLGEERACLPAGSAFHDLIDGAEMDVRGATYQTFDDLLVYARRVGGSIGRLSLDVFGTNDRAAAEPLADDLGVALQLTNVLRDIREDLARGRVYIPAEDLERFGVTLDPPSGPVADLVRFEAARAEEWFARGLRVLGYLDRPCATSVAAMAGMYRRLLARIEREPESVLERRVSLPVWEKGWVAARSLIGAAA
ncbi:MAG TPA: squalene/phytoene synthase family protein [Gaiellaceae bacterium]|nr:squalene/phytoene synthase family protein [Gaiellaceae bacterium]